MATAAEVQMMNDALFQLGREPVPDLSDASLEASNAAVKIRRVMEQCRDRVLERHGWICALEYGVLSPQIAPPAPAPNWRYPTIYALPADALLVWEIEGVTFTGDFSCWAPRWQVGTLETDAGSRKIVRARDQAQGLNAAWTRRCNWASLTAHLRDAIAWEMAARAAYSVLGDQQRAAQLAKDAEAKVIAAIGQDGTQEGNQPSLAPSIPRAIRRFAGNADSTLGAWEGFGPV